MNYRLQSKQKTAWLSRYGFLFAGVVGIYFLMQLLFPGLFASWLTLLDGKYQLVHNLTTWWSNKEQLLAENDLLRTQLQKQTATQSLAAANREYYAQLERELKDNAATEVAASVLLRPPVAMYDRFILDKGHVDGVVPGALVSVAGEYVVGYVDHVAEHHSRVVLLSSAEQDFVVDVDGYLYQAEGQGGGSVLMKLSRNLLNQTGQTVRVPGAGGRVLGSVVSAEAAAQDSYVTGYTVLAHNMFQTRFVTVLDEQWQDVDEAIFDIENNDEEEQGDAE